MQSDQTTKTCLLFLDAPFQSYGASSDWDIRGTQWFPTKSSTVGMLTAAMGYGRTHPELEALLPRLSSFHMIAVAVPTEVRLGNTYSRKVMPSKMRDYHVIREGQTRRCERNAIGDLAVNTAPVVTERWYLNDSRFIVLLTMPTDEVARIQAALENPVYLISFGRRNCLPSSPLLRGVFDSVEEAWNSEVAKALTRGCQMIELPFMRDVDSPGEGNDVIMDVPISFGRRKFGSRSVLVNIPNSMTTGGDSDEESNDAAVPDSV